MTVQLGAARVALDKSGSSVKSKISRACVSTASSPERLPEHLSKIHSPARKLYCSPVSGTTLSLPCRTSGESANSFVGSRFGLFHLRAWGEVQGTLLNHRVKPSGDQPSAEKTGASVLPSRAMGEMSGALS